MLKQIFNKLASVSLILFMGFIVSCNSNSSVSSPDPSESLVAGCPTLLQMVEQSTYITHAIVAEVTSAYESLDADADMVMSQVQIDIIETWKGALPATGFEFRSYGGTVDGMLYEDEASTIFENGEEVVVFLGKFNQGIFPVAHYCGKLLVESEVITETGDSLTTFRDEILDLVD